MHPKVVSERLGHASIGITLDTYGHAMPGMQEEAAEKIHAGLREALRAANVVAGMIASKGFENVRHFPAGSGTLGVIAGRRRPVGL